MLHEGLLGILGGNPPETYRGNFDLDFLAQLSIRLDAAGIKQCDLVVLGNNLLRHDQFSESPDVPAFLVNNHSQFACRPHSPLGGRQQCLLDSVGEDIPVDALLAFPELKDC